MAMQGMVAGQSSWLHGSKQNQLSCPQESGSVRWINLEVPGLCRVSISQQKVEFALSDLPHDLHDFPREGAEV